MKFLKIFAGIIVTLVLLFFIIGFFLPRSFSMHRSIVINAPDSVVYSNVANYNQFLKWNPWYKMEPTAKVTISGPVAQVNHTYRWAGKKTGVGQMEITGINPNTGVNEKLDLITMGMQYDIKFAIKPVDGGTEVDWIMSGEGKSITDKWFNSMSDMMMGKDFENGLKDLKALSESK